MRFEYIRGYLVYWDTLKVAFEELGRGGGGEEGGGGGDGGGYLFGIGRIGKDKIERR